MKRTTYEVTATWIDANGNPSTFTDTVACGKSALAEYVAEVKRWHTAHNHTDVNVTYSVKS